MVGHHDACTAYINGALGIINAHDTFQRKLAVPLGAQPLRILPTHGLVQHGGKILAYGYGQVCARRNMAREVRHIEFFPGQEIPGPPWMGEKGPERRRGEPGRGGKASAQITLPISAGNGINGQRHDLKIGRPRPR